ncbi:GNAT family N-acetyltransferase [Brachybacterium hainanense]|uniref:GNAT family N-acetyltransferase n=1 Tax=Brachybacterium hainanense TaxID=1541174 RepID=A0ABV6R8E1_9MICO
MPSDLLSCPLSRGSSLAPPRGLPELSLHRTTSADHETLAELYARSYPPEIGAADVEAARAEIAATFAGEYGEPLPGACLLARRDGHPAGAVLTTTRSLWDPHLAGPFVIDLFVAPEHRDRGIGGALISTAMQTCAAAGHAALSLRIGAGTSPAAHALYRRLGFTEVPAPPGPLTPAWSSRRRRGAPFSRMHRRGAAEGQCRRSPSTPA